MLTLSIFSPACLALTALLSLLPFLGISVVRIINRRKDGPALTIEDLTFGLVDSGQSQMDRRTTVVRKDPPWKRLSEIDPRFSPPLFLDFLALLYVRGVQARASGLHDTIRPYVTDALLAQWKKSRDAAVGQVEEVVVAGVNVLDLAGFESDVITCHVRFEACFVEVPASGGQGATVYVSESWTIRRARSAQSKTPEAIRSLGCPSCGASESLAADGTCTYCNRVVNRGEFDWLVTEAHLEDKRRELDRSRLVANASTDDLDDETPDESTESDPAPMSADLLDVRIAYSTHLSQERSAFLDRHPDFDWHAFNDRVRESFFAIQRAWSNLDWDAARAYETDNLFSMHRYWIEGYRAHGLRNVLEDLELKSIEVVSIEHDAFFVSITVCVDAGLIDYTVDAAQQVLEGSKLVPTRFIEYWTFIASADADFSKKPKEGHCPSCGAQISVSQSGVCSSCESLITSGKFGWVLSRIEQPETCTQVVEERVGDPGAWPTDLSTVRLRSAAEIPHGTRRWIASIGLVLAILSCLQLVIREAGLARPALRLVAFTNGFVLAPLERIDPRNDGKLVCVSGRATGATTIVDPEFGVQVEGTFLGRTVEMYQWVEIACQNGASMSFSYNLQWESHIIDSSAFHDRVKHLNPQSGPAASPLPLGFLTLKAPELTMGAHVLSPDMVGQLGEPPASPLSVNSVPKVPRDVWGGSLTYASESAYFNVQGIGNHPLSTPVPGALRVSWVYGPSQPVTVIAAQRGKTFEAFRAPDGQLINLAVGGNLSPYEIKWLLARNSSGPSVIESLWDLTFPRIWELFFLWLGLTIVLRWPHALRQGPFHPLGFLRSLHSGDWGKAMVSGFFLAAAVAALLMLATWGIACLLQVL